VVKPYVAKAMNKAVMTSAGPPPDGNMRRPKRLIAERTLKLAKGSDVYSHRASTLFANRLVPALDPFMFADDAALSGRDELLGVEEDCLGRVLIN